MSDDWKDIDRRLSELETLAKQRVPMSDASFAAIKELQEQVSRLEIVLEEFPVQVAGVRENVAKLREELAVTLGQLQVAINRGHRKRDKDYEIIQQSVSGLGDKMDAVIHAIRGGGGA